MLTLQSETQIGKLSTVVNVDWAWGVWGLAVPSPWSEGVREGGEGASSHSPPCLLLTASEGLFVWADCCF